MQPTILRHAYFNPTNKSKIRDGRQSNTCNRSEPAHCDPCSALKRSSLQQISLPFHRLPPPVSLETTSCSHPTLNLKNSRQQLRGKTNAERDRFSNPPSVSTYKIGPALPQLRHNTDYIAKATWKVHSLYVAFRDFIPVSQDKSSFKPYKAKSSSVQLR